MNERPVRAELTEEALYISFQLFADERELLDRWDAQAGAYLFSEEQICAIRMLTEDRSRMGQIQSFGDRGF